MKTPWTDPTLLAPDEGGNQRSLIELQPPVRSSERGGLPNLASFRYLQARQGRAHSSTGIVACVVMVGPL